MEKNLKKNKIELTYKATPKTRLDRKVISVLSRSLIFIENWSCGLIVGSNLNFVFDILSLLALDNLEKKKKHKSKSDSDDSDSEMLTRKQKRQKVAEEKDSLLNHLNKTKDCLVTLESDSSTSTSLSKAKMDNDKIFSKDELLDMANERAKRKLLESDDDTEILGNFC